MSADAVFSRQASDQPYTGSLCHLSAVFPVERDLNPPNLAVNRGVVTRRLLFGCLDALCHGCLGREGGGRRSEIPLDYLVGS